MSYNSLPIKWKILLPVVVIMIFIGIFYTLLSGSIITKVVIGENRANMEHMSEIVFASVTDYMFADKYHEKRDKFLEHMNKMLPVSIFRSEKLDEQFGKKAPEEYARTASEKEVLSSGKTVFIFEDIKGKAHLRGIFPYRNVTNYMGIDCTGCHMQGTKEGDIIGGLSIAIPLSKMAAALARSRLIIAGIAIAVTLVTIFIIFFIVRTFLLKPLNAAVDVVERAAAKDFSKILKVRYRDEIGRLSESVNAMSGALAISMKEVASISGELSLNADTLKKSIEQSVEGTRQQAEQASLIATASEEMSQTVAGIAQSGAKAADLSVMAMEVANRGKNVLEESVGKIESAGQSTRELATMIEKLNASVTEIGNIITVIKDIADQTNLLALNAAIEAARAGEQGRGFAVVADEVRKLAERTTKATGEISQRIAMVQEGSRQTAESMENSLVNVSDSVLFMKKAQAALDEIVTSIRSSSDEVSQIAAAVEEQSTTSDEITRNIGDISVNARNTEAATEKLLDIFETLNRHSQSLSSMAAAFKFFGKK
ncbi:MAG: hypothetical protein C0402_15135 [Thermodesulfovibrio sp.]|nr:hypothetical protein [Thermodesulfovibrio sp.]